MRIGFDVSQAGSQKAGCGYFAYALARALQIFPTDNSITFHPTFGDFFFTKNKLSDYSFIENQSCIGPMFNRKIDADIFWKSNNVENLIGNLDILHSNNFWCPTNLSNTRLVYTLYDTSFMVNPNWTTESNRVGCFDGVFNASIYADMIIAISNSTKDQFLKFFPNFPDDRISVVYPASRFEHTDLIEVMPKRMQFVKDFWLVVGTIEPRKNLYNLVDAYWHYLDFGGKPFPLVIAGGYGWMMDELASYIDDNGLSENVIFLGYVTDQNLVWLYKNCYANLYPSHYEGFGLPVLESMQFGAPCIVSDTTSIPEVVGDAALMLNPDNPLAWGLEMYHLCNSNFLRSKLSNKSISNAARFDWTESAIKVMKIYEYVMNLPKRAIYDA